MGVTHRGRDNDSVGYLDQELIPPVVQVLEGFCSVHIIHQDAAVSSAVERHTETLETLLSRCVPNLLWSKNVDCKSAIAFWQRGKGTAIAHRVKSSATHEGRFVETNVQFTSTSRHTCIVTSLSSTWTPFVKKSAPLIFYNRKP